MRAHSLPRHLRDAVSKQNQSDLSQACLHPVLRSRHDSQQRTGRGEGLHRRVHDVQSIFFPSENEKVIPSNSTVTHYVLITVLLQHNPTLRC